MLRTFNNSIIISGGKLSTPVISPHRMSSMMSKNETPQQKSSVVTLPRLPVPALNDTLAKYLRLD